MSIPVTNIQPPQIVTTQPKSDIAANNADIAAKKIKPEETKNGSKNENMKLNKSAVGVINPPQDFYKFSPHQEVKEKQEANKDILDLAKPLSASSLSGEGESKKHGGFFSKLLILGAAITGAIFIAKKVKLSSIASGTISVFNDLKTHYDDISKTVQKKALKAFHLKKTSVRVIDESANTVRETLETTRKIASEAKNIKEKTPKITIKVKESAGGSEKAIKKAVIENNINSLSEEELKQIEYVDLEYVKSQKKNPEVSVDTIKTKFVDGSGPQSEIFDKIANFFKGLFKD